MNRQDAETLVRFLVQNKIPFTYAISGELNRIAIPHGTPLRDILPALISDDPIITSPSIRSGAEGLIIT